MNDHAYALSRTFMHTAERLQRLPTLYDLSDEFLALLSALDAAEDETDASAVEAQLETVCQALSQKVDGYVSVIRELEKLAEARRAEANRLRDRASSAERAVDRLQQRLKEYMEQTGQQRIETGRFTIRIQKNSQPTVKFDDEPALEDIKAYERPPAGVPLEYVTVVTLYKVDKRRILADAKVTGEIPDGVNVVHNMHLRIA